MCQLQMECTVERKTPKSPRSAATNMATMCGNGVLCLDRPLLGLMAQVPSRPICKKGDGNCFA